MTGYAKLKELAEAAAPGRTLLQFNTFKRACTPAALLELIADFERSQRMLLAAAMDMGAIGNALNADMNSDGEEILSMVVDIQYQNRRLRGFLSDISKTSGDKCSVMAAREMLKEFGQ